MKFSQRLREMAGLDDVSLPSATPSEPAVSPAPVPEKKPYDQLLDISDTSAVHSVALDGYLTFISQTYNGGIQQVVENEHLESMYATIQLLKRVPGPKAEEALRMLQGLREPVQQYAQEYAALRRSDDAEYEHEQAVERLEAAVGAFEDWLYGPDGDALHAEVYAHLTA